MGKIMIHNTKGKDDLERATLAFIVGNAALTAGQEATVLLTIDGVWFATRGYADGLQAEGLSPISEQVSTFISNGGQVWVCGVCAKPRNITPDDLIEGAQIVGAAVAIEAMVNGAQTLSF
ncbi:MAG: DsrE family protein [Anaerolineales bacterium]